MCRKVLVALLVFVCLHCDRAGAVQYGYLVRFTDKNNTPFSLSSPLAYLSPRAMARRTMQGIAVDSADLPVNHTYIDSVLMLTGGILHESSKWLNLCVILLSDSTQIHALDGKAFIRSTQYLAYYGTDLHHKPSPAAHAAGKTTSSDSPYYGNTWDQTSVVNGFVLHDAGFNGQGKIIAVLDAGFINTDVHPGFDSMYNSGRLVDHYNFNLATPGVYNSDTHGYEVLSTMAGYVPGTYVGTAPMASYALYITEDYSGENRVELVNMLCGAERADSIGADVITTSLGYNTFDDPTMDFVFATDFDGKTTIAAQAANIATMKGMLFVASAGNEGGGGWNMILTPGDADSALTIGSVTSSLTPYYSSGYGPNAAGQVKPDVCGLGQTASVFYGTNGYGALGGTSLSTPQIAGWAACLWQANPTATPWLIRQAIIRCASSYSAPTDHIGYGVPNFACTEQILKVNQPQPPFTGANWVIATPNPFGNELLLAVSPEENGNVDFMLMDIAGRTVSDTRHYMAKGTNQTVSISLPDVHAGVYVLMAVSATQQQVLKVVKR
jgi:serine protease AprX